MIRTLLIILIAVLLVEVRAQEVKVEKLSFCTEKYDEFAPQKVKEGLIFISNRKNDVINTYVEKDLAGKEKYLSDIYIAKQKEKDSTSFSLTSLDFNKLNLPEGPATANSSVDYIIFTRQIESKKKQKPQIVLFETYFTNGNWSEPVQLEFTKNKFNYSQPFLSEDGERLYFVSDNTNGKGGLDIWITEKELGKWTHPTNLGESINTDKDEVFPYEYSKGILYFSSNKSNGLGGFDIYLGGEDLDSKLLPSPINSSFDDFSFITSNGVEGYLSSNRDGSDDIFIVNRTVPELKDCIESENVSSCYVFYDLDSGLEQTSYTYKWYFGDGQIAYGDSARHCFASEGKYFVKMNLIDTTNGEEIEDVSSFEIQIKKQYPHYINYIEKSDFKEIMVFNGDKTKDKSDSFVWKINDKIFLDITSVKLDEKSCLPGIQTVMVGGFRSDSLCYSKFLFNNKTHQGSDKFRLDTHYSKEHPLTDELIEFLNTTFVNKNAKDFFVTYPINSSESDELWLDKFKLEFEEYYHRKLELRKDSIYQEMILCAK